MLRERFSRPLDPAALALSESTREDRAILYHDLWGSVAHATMLGATGIVPAPRARRIVRGLIRIGREAARGRFPLDPSLEDVHLNVEAALTRALGDDGARLHTGRSRNDQVATDLRLYLRDALLDLEEASADVADALLAQARGPAGREVVAGWTHLQPAQRVYWAQVLGAHALRFLRDVERFRRTRRTIRRSPLGSGALAGSSLPLDRDAVARSLGFEGPTRSSYDAVADRDPEIETVFDLALTAAHASQLAEELVLGAMPEVARVRLADPFVTTSSLMPHKRNPDLAELVRAEAAPAVGRLVAHLTLLKGLPLSYQRDLQVGKPIVFDAVARGRAVLDVLAPMIRTAEFLTPPPGRREAVGAVELVDALVAQGTPFRSAHAAVARFARTLEASGRSWAEIDPATLARAFPRLGEFRMPTAQDEPERRTTSGGSSWREVVRSLDGIAAEIGLARSQIARERRRLAAVRRRSGVPEEWFAVGGRTKATSRRVRGPARSRARGGSSRPSRRR